MLEERGEGDLRAYWLEIARLQDRILGPYIERSGLSGMHEYWSRIVEEENCRADLDLTDSYFEFKMLECPSLKKNLDNDAGQFSRYCDHCAGWVGPVVKKHGYHLVSDVISRTEPHCVMRIYKNEKEAAEYARSAQLPVNPHE